MDGLTLEIFMRQDPHTAPFFEGVFAADVLPRVLHKKPSLLIANLDPITKKGSHWVAFYRGCEGRGEYFDSYGLPPMVTEHKRFLNRTCQSWRYSPVCLQAFNSTVCGEYCLMYLVYKAHGYSLNQFVQLFSDDVEKNDILVHQMIKRYSKGHVFCDDFIVNSNRQSCCARK